MCSLFATNKSIRNAARGLFFVQLKSPLCRFIDLHALSDRLQT